MLNLFYSKICIQSEWACQQKKTLLVLWVLGIEPATRSYSADCAQPCVWGSLYGMLYGVAIYIFINSPCIVL